MAERRNGSFSQNKRKHGSDQRGIMAAPRGPQFFDHRQSRADKARILEAHKAKQEQSRASERLYGNPNLPAAAHRDEIVSLLENYKAIIVGGQTGSGKSTQTPQFLYEAGYDKTYVLVPRRIIADGLRDRIVEEMTPHAGAENAGQLVGLVHGERAILSDDNRIVVMTPNTFARMEADIRAQHADKKVAIISDEIHEANLYTEIATGIAAKAVDENDSWRLIAASATHNSAALQHSFSELNGGFVPSVTINGRPFELEIDDAPFESPMEVYAREGRNHDKTMIFTSGKGEIDHIIEETMNLLERQRPGGSEKVIFRKLHGELNDIEMSHINDPVPEGYRIAIVSSPAGMSGITIPGVTCVITDGTINRSELDDDKVPGLRRDYLSKAEVTQQMGRAGRDVAGGIGILAAPTAIQEDKLRAKGQTVEVEQMSFRPFNDRNEFGPPEIYHSNLSRVVLTVASLDRRFGEINPYLPHQVSATDIITAEESLARLGALDDADIITQLGRTMSKFPVKPELSRGLSESLRRQRSLPQLARSAIIAAALEAGGVQDFSTNKGSREWEKLLRPSTNDDMIAQLDIMLTPMPKDHLAYIEFLEAHDLSYKRVERTKKVTKKILRECGVRIENIVLTPPTRNEEDELRNDMAAGMIDLVYEKSRILDRRQHYQNIHGGADSTQRFMGSRSVISPNEHKLVAGFPRWYTTAKKDGSRKKNNVVELSMPVEPTIIAEYAAENKLLTRGQLDAAFEHGRVVERYQPMFGSIPVGSPEIGIVNEVIPERSQQLLVRRVIESPGLAQRALREVADEIAYYQARLPEGDLSNYLKHDAPELITKTSIEALIRNFARSTRLAYEVDQALARYVFHENISINKYFDESNRAMLQQRTPQEIEFEGRIFAVNYTNGQPYIVGARAAVRDLVKGKELQLPDGREILVQVTQPGQGKVRVKATDL